MFHVPNPHVPSETACNKTVHNRSKHLIHLRGRISGQGSSSSQVQLQDEIKVLNKEEREELVKSLYNHTRTDVATEKILAFKADLSIPWNKLRTMRRWVHVPVTNHHHIFLLFYSITPAHTIKVVKRMGDTGG